MMQILAIIALNLLLLVNLMQGIILKENKSRVTTAKKITELNEVNQIESKDTELNTAVLSSFIVSYEAITSNQQEESDEEIVVNENDIQPQEVSVSEPTPTQTLDTDYDNEEKSINTPDNATSLMNSINEYRGQNGLSAFSFDETVCRFANTRANELTSDFSHSGFRSRIDSGTLPYSDYSYIAENIADTDTPDRAFELWKNSPGHNENMLNGSTYGCIGNTGRLYTLEIWEP